MRVEQGYNYEVEAVRSLSQSQSQPQLKVISEKPQPVRDSDIRSTQHTNTEVNKEELKRIIEEIRKKMDYLNKYLRIDIDNELEIPVIKVVEKETEKVIRQIPPDYMLNIMKRIDEMLGILINERI